MIFAEIAITARDGNFPGIGRNFLLHELLIFDAAAFETFPRNKNRAVLPGLLAADKRLYRGMGFDEPRQERTLVHVVKHR